MRTLSPAAADAVARIERSGGMRVELPTVLPARTVLEMSGEGMRSRLCLFQDGQGRELCLRPEMTTPIAELVAQGALAASRYVYAGDVFRLPIPGSDDALEFAQAGFEWFGDGSVDEDVDAALLAFEAGNGGKGAIQAVFGDVALYRAVVDVLDFSPVWKNRLKRSFARTRGPLAVLGAAPKSTGGDTSALAQLLSRLSDADAGRVIDEVMALAGVQPAGGRPAFEIAERLRERSLAQPPDERSARFLADYLALKGPAAEAISQLRAFETQASVKLSGPLDRLENCLQRLSARGVDLAAAQFDPELGRRFEYYDGFVFELRRTGGPGQTLASGGRYDGLVQRLKPGAAPVPAIGASIRLDRLEASP